MDDTTSNPTQPAMTIGRSVMLYGAALLVLVLGVVLTIKVEAFTSTFLVVIYLGLGIALNRVVLRQLIEWHPVYNTLRNVASAKLGMVLLWPLRYPVLFFQLLVNKHL